VAILRVHGLATFAGVVSAILLAGLCFAQQGRQQKSSGGTMIVDDILTARCAVEGTDSPSLVVTVKAIDPQGPPRNPRIIPGRYESPPKDGIQDLFVLADSVGLGGQPAETEFTVNYEWKGFRDEAPWLKAVRVHCASGALILPVEN